MGEVTVQLSFSPFVREERFLEEIEILHAEEIRHQTNFNRDLREGVVTEISAMFQKESEKTFSFFLAPTFVMLHPQTLKPRQETYGAKVSLESKSGQVPLFPSSPVFSLSHPCFKQSWRQEKSGGERNAFRSSTPSASDRGKILTDL